MLMGKPVVVLNETWLADIVNQTRIGIAVEPSAESIVAGIVDIDRNYTNFKNNIDSACQEYLERNSWTALISKISNLSGLQLNAALESNDDSLLSQIGHDVTNCTPTLILTALASQLLIDPKRILKLIETSPPLSAAIRHALNSEEVGKDVKAQHFEILEFAKRTS